ncbi:MAG: hypothetical protein ACI38Q_04420 [Candidatus Bruticola sp.]
MAIKGLLNVKENIISSILIFRRPTNLRVLLGYPKPDRVEDWLNYFDWGTNSIMADYDDNEVQLAEAQTVSKTDQKCPNCGGPMTFSPSSGKMVCDYCEYEEEVKKDSSSAPIQAAAAGTAGATAAATHDVSDQGQRSAVRVKNNRSGNIIPGIPIEHTPEQANTNWGDEKKVVKCKSCGATAVYDAKQISDTCPYCDSTLVTQEDENKVMAPQGIIPFSVDKEKADKEFRSWIKGLWFAPNDLHKRASKGEINGVYAPYWSYDTASKAKYKGEYGIEHKKIDKNGNTHTKIDWHPTTGSLSTQFDDKLILSAEKKNAELIKGIEPFDMKGCKEYRPEYVAGFISERYSKGVSECWEHAQKELKEELKQMAEEDIQSRHNTSHSRISTLDASFYDTYYKYILLPMWLSSYKYKGSVYHFVINGQTGTVSGDRPWSVLKLLLTAICLMIFLWAALGAEGKDATTVFIIGAIVSVISWIIAKIFG